MQKIQANNGILLRVGEHLLVTNEYQVIKVSQFCYHNHYHNFVKGQVIVVTWA